MYNIQHPIKIAYALYVSISIISFLFYSTFLVVPASAIYRRPALEFYAKYNVCYYLFNIIFSSLLFSRVHEAYCASSVIILLLASIIQPLVLFRVLQIDSGFWQGLDSNPTGNNPNPLSEVWDSVGLDTATSMGEKLEQFGRTSSRLPVLHYGLLEFDSTMGYVAGGFSRVYFGNIKERYPNLKNKQNIKNILNRINKNKNEDENKKVALKIVSAYITSE